MKYLTFMRSSESYRQSPPPPALMQAMGEFIGRAAQAGTLVDTGGLLPSRDGFRVRLTGGTATEFMELHRKHWPGFEGESEVRPIDA